MSQNTREPSFRNDMELVLLAGSGVISMLVWAVMVHGVLYDPPVARSGPRRSIWVHGIPWDDVVHFCIVATALLVYKSLFDLWAIRVAWGAEHALGRAVLINFGAAVCAAVFGVILWSTFEISRMYSLGVLLFYAEIPVFLFYLWRECRHYLWMRRWLTCLALIAIESPFTVVASVIPLAVLQGIKALMLGV